MRVWQTSNIRGTALSMYEKRLRNVYLLHHSILNRKQEEDEIGRKCFRGRSSAFALQSLFHFRCQHVHSTENAQIRYEGYILQS